MRQLLTTPPKAGRKARQSRRLPPVNIWLVWNRFTGRYRGKNFDEAGLADLHAVFVSWGLDPLTPWRLRDGTSGKTRRSGRELKSLLVEVKSCHARDEPDRPGRLWRPKAPAPVRLVLIQFVDEKDGRQKVACFHQNRRHVGRTKEGCALHLVLKGCGRDWPWVFRSGLEEGVELDRGESIGTLADMIGFPPEAKRVEPPKELEIPF
jgi:hypothetical protein